MDRQEYLNQISAENRPMTAQKNGFFGKILSSKIFLIGIGAVALLILIIIVGAVISGAKGNVKENIYALRLHANNTMEVLDDYRKDVKSSDLRSNGATLSSLLSDLNGKLDNYITEKYEIKSSEIEKKLDKNKVSELNLERDGLESELFEAKINGILDRIYAHEMAYEIEMIMTKENQIINSSGDDALKELLTNNYGSLKNLYDIVSNFSEAK